MGIIITPIEGPRLKKNYLWGHPKLPLCEHSSLRNSSAHSVSSAARQLFFLKCYTEIELAPRVERLSPQAGRKVYTHTRERRCTTQHTREKPHSQSVCDPREG